MGYDKNESVQQPNFFKYQTLMFNFSAYWNSFPIYQHTLVRLRWL